MSYLDLFDLILDPLDRVPVDVVPSVHLSFSHHLCSDHYGREEKGEGCEETKRRRPTSKVAQDRHLSNDSRFTKSGAKSAFTSAAEGDAGASVLAAATSENKQPFQTHKAVTGHRKRKQRRVGATVCSLEMVLQCIGKYEQEGGKNNNNNTMIVTGFQLLKAPHGSDRNLEALSALLQFSATL